MHTEPSPGPWEVSDKHPTLVIGYDPRAMGGTTRLTIARVDPGGDRLPVVVGDANARLIAAAPELLSSLRSILSSTNSHTRDNHLNNGSCSCSAFRVKAKELIKRIEEGR